MLSAKLIRILDVLIVDTAAGISASVVNFARACQEIIVVVCDEPTSLTDAYAFIKLLNRDYGLSNFHVDHQYGANGSARPCLIPEIK